MTRDAPVRGTKVYLGDSVYAEMDGIMIKLTTENSAPGDPSNVIYLEWEVYESLVAFAKQCWPP